MSFSHTLVAECSVWERRAEKRSTACLRNSSKQKSGSVVLCAGSRMCLYFTIAEHQFLFCQDTPFSLYVLSIRRTQMLNFEKAGELHSWSTCHLGIRNLC